MNLALPLRKFVVMTNEMTSEQQLAFVTRINDLGIGWARYTSGGWLLVTQRFDVSADLIRAWVMGIAPGIDNCVFEVSGVIRWCGLISGNRAQAAETWMTQFWTG